MVEGDSRPTLTAIAAAGSLAGCKGSMVRRLIAIAAMLLGGLAGAACVLHVRIVAPLAIALVALIAVAGTTLALGRLMPAGRRPTRSAVDRTTSPLSVM